MGTNVENTLFSLSTNPVEILTKLGVSDKGVQIFRMIGDGDREAHVYIRHKLKMSSGRAKKL